MTLAVTQDQRERKRGGARPKDGVVQVARVQKMNLSAEQMLERMSPDIYRYAYEAGMSLSAFLETENPSEPEDLREGMDAFARMIRAADIRTQEIPWWGVTPDTFDRFEETEQLRAMVPEFIARVWRRTVHMPPQERAATFLAADGGVGTILQPWADQPGVRYDRSFAPAIPLSTLVARRTSIRGTNYRAFYMNTDVAEDLRFVRVSETAEVPRATLTGGQHDVRLRKYGRALETSYEFLRTMTIDRVAFYIARLAIQAEIDKVAAAMAVLISGDGNSGTAATVYNLTTLDPAATAGTLTLKGWLSFKLKFPNPYTLTAALAQEAVALQMMLLNVGSANVPLVTLQQTAGFGSFTPINPGLADNVRLGWLSEAPALKIVGLDQRFGLEHITQIGANITEVAKFVMRQTEAIVFTEVEGFAILDGLATRILNVNA